MSRSARCERSTKETEIVVELEIDGTGKYEIHTGIGFFDHMLEGFARHGFFDLTIKVTGDTYVDAHHTVEDTGIVLGQAFARALGNKEGISIPDVHSKSYQVYPAVRIPLCIPLMSGPCI